MEPAGLGHVATTRPVDSFIDEAGSGIHTVCLLCGTVIQ